MRKKDWRLLQAYKATGLSPDLVEHYKALLSPAVIELAEQLLEVVPNDSLERLYELLQADMDGRVVMLPCKAGDTVFAAGNGVVKKCYISEVYLDDKEGLQFMVTFDCNLECDGCPFSNWHQEYCGEYSCEGEYGEGVLKGAEFMVTWFRTSEEAEAVTKEEQA